MDTENPILATIALTEKKVDMALDDIIKLSKRKTNVNKGKNPRREKKKTQYFNGAARNNTFKVRHHMNSLSAVRQGAVAKRRSNFQGTQFPVTTNTIRKAATAPQLTVRVRAFNGGRMTTANQSRSRMLEYIRTCLLFWSPLISSIVSDRGIFYSKFLVVR